MENIIWDAAIGVDAYVCVNLVMAEMRWCECLTGCERTRYIIAARIMCVWSKLVINKVCVCVLLCVFFVCSPNVIAICLVTTMHQWHAEKCFLLYSWVCLRNNQMWSSGNKWNVSLDACDLLTLKWCVKIIVRIFDEFSIPFDNILCSYELYHLKF